MTSTTIQELAVMAVKGVPTIDRRATLEDIKTAAMILRTNLSSACLLMEMAETKMQELDRLIESLSATTPTHAPSPATPEKSKSTKTP